MTHDDLVNFALDSAEDAGEVAHRRHFGRANFAHRSKTFLIARRSSSGTEERAIGSSGCCVELSGVRTLGGKYAWPDASGPFASERASMEISNPWLPILGSVVAPKSVSGSAPIPCAKPPLLLESLLAWSEDLSLELSGEFCCCWRVSVSL